MDKFSGYFEAGRILGISKKIRRAAWERGLKYTQERDTDLLTEYVTFTVEGEKNLVKLFKHDYFDFLKG